MIRMRSKEITHEWNIVGLLFLFLIFILASNIRQVIHSVRHIRRADKVSIMVKVDVRNRVVFGRVFVMARKVMKIRDEEEIYQ